MAAYQVAMLTMALLLVSSTMASALPVELIEPSDHGLANQKTPLAVSPAMLTFFKGTHTTVELPEAIDSATIARASHGTPPETREDQSVSEDSRRKDNSAVVAGVVSGVVCLVVVVGAAVGFLVFKRRNGPTDESDSDTKVLNLFRWNRGSEVTLGSSGP